jgi:hypothetical protein
MDFFLRKRGDYHNSSHVPIAQAIAQSTGQPVASTLALKATHSICADLHTIESAETARARIARAKIARAGIVRECRDCKPNIAPQIAQ